MELNYEYVRALRLLAFLVVETICAANTLKESLGQIQAEKQP
jgi:hypothetical protein